MSHNEFVVHATERFNEGKGASRRLRKEALVPGIVYGADIAPQNITLSDKDLRKSLEKETFYTKILELVINEKGKSEKVKVVLADLQRHPLKKMIMHVDFLRVSENVMLTRSIPLHFINADKCAGFKAGGIIAHHATDVEIKCYPRHLPSFITVDLEHVSIDSVVHISDLTLPKDVHAVNAALAVASVHRSKIKEEVVATTVASAVPATKVAAPAKAAAAAKAAPAKAAKAAPAKAAKAAPVKKK